MKKYNQLMSMLKESNNNISHYNNDIIIENEKKVINIYMGKNFIDIFIYENKKNGKEIDNKTYITIENAYNFIIKHLS